MAVLVPSRESGSFEQSRLGIPFATDAHAGTFTFNDLHPGAEADLAYRFVIDTESLLKRLAFAAIDDREFFLEWVFGAHSQI
jgi:hypothetical protein